MTILADALAHHQAGRLPEAEALCRKIVADEPGNGEALRLLGKLAREAGQPATAIEPIRRAIRLDGGNCELHNEHGMALLEAGELGDAKKAFLRALQLSPRYAEAMLNLAGLLMRTGGAEEAATCCRAVLHLHPENADAASRLGAALHRLGRVEEALQSYRLAVRLEPTDADAHAGLGDALLALDRPEEAVGTYQAALALRSDRAATHHDLGRALARLDRLEEAIVSFRRRLELDPRDVEARSELALALQGSGQVEEALRCVDEALVLAPEDGDLHYHRARLLLLLGRLEEGWTEHEWRWRARSFLSPRRDFAAPRWDGAARSDATLLIHAEPDLGDTLQFVRYVAAARRRVGRTLLEAPAALHRLLAGLSSIDALIAPGEALPPYDIEAPLLALPHLLGEAAGLPPAYLAADPAKVQGWAERIGRHGQRVGIVWADERGDRRHSVPGGALRPLLERDARFFSLQPEPQRHELAEVGLDKLATDLSSDLTDLTEIAAILASLDLLITVDTTTAHLAGALGRPVWLMLPFAPDWRWGMAGNATRWYPQMRLFRQPAPGRWDAVIGEVASELTRLYL